MTNDRLLRQNARLEPNQESMKAFMITRGRYKFSHKSIALAPLHPVTFFLYPCPILFAEEKEEGVEEVAVEKEKGGDAFDSGFMFNEKDSEGEYEMYEDEADVEEACWSS